MSSNSSPFFQIRVSARDAEEAERAAAEAFAAGASGLEERTGEAGVTLLVYAPAAQAAAVYEAARGALGSGSTLDAPELVAERDWSEAWKAGLAPIVVSPRLVVRPSFAPHPAAPGQRQLVIDPEQAFGTGGHASTRLALEWIDALAGALAPGARVLDVGTGTGVLALAAVALTGCRAAACDVDPLAAEAARRNARRNRLAGRVAVFNGSTRALGDGARFDLVVANLLRSELEPLIGELARCARPGGWVVLAVLLTTDCAAVEALARGEGLHARSRREREDENGARWAAPLMQRAPADASLRAAAPGSR
ncbi:MAG TPA: 50S ribosomal protein L11 methyltransferase [Myxococcota bacterium]